jgi:FKBP-type peptidyl-prolyl cis-trans isomerase FkpA
MKFIYKLLLAVPLLFLLVGCPDDATVEPEVVRGYQEVYNEDLAEIEKFLMDNTMTVDANYNVTFSEITAANPGTPVKNRPDLLFKNVVKEGVTHKVYYIKFREGVGANPTKLDSVFSAYKGFKTDRTSFDQSINPTWFGLDEVIQGWTEIFPEFKTGNAVLNNDGTTTFTDFGAGVMFIPSGLAYFNRGSGSIGTYSPIYFSFKLMKLRNRDHDGDKILSKDEFGPNLALRDDEAPNADGAGFPDYKDFDDDNDGVLTKREIKLPDGSFPAFNLIPNCAAGGNGKKKHLDPFCN